MIPGSRAVFLPQVVLVIDQPDRKQHAGPELQEPLVKLLGHEVEPTDGSR